MSEPTGEDKVRAITEELMRIAANNDPVAFPGCHYWDDGQCPWEHAGAVF